MSLNFFAYANLDFEPVATCCGGGLDDTALGCFWMCVDGGGWGDDGDSSG